MRCARLSVGPLKFLPLVWAGIWRRPGRTALTMVSIASAFVLFGVLQGFTAGLGNLVSAAHADVLFTVGRANLLERLPIADLATIQRIPGVTVVAREVAFGGVFRPPADFVPADAIDVDELRQLDAHLTVTPAQWAAMKATRSGALVPADLAATHGWKVGQRIPLKPQFYANRDGSGAWQVDIVGIFPANPDDSLFRNFVLLNYDYIDQSRTEGTGYVNGYYVRVASPAVAGKVASAIDGGFANSEHRTKTYSVRQLAQAEVAGIGDVGLAVRLISGAVFFALLFSVGAVMIQSGRERTVELGVLKALGYGDRSLIVLTLAEAGILCLVSATIGLAISTFVYPIAVQTIHFNVKAGPAIAVGLVYAAALALITGSVPAWRAGRLAVVDALAGR